MNLYMEEKLPRGWLRDIPGHYNSHTSVGGYYKSPTNSSWFNMLNRCYLTRVGKANSSEYYQYLGIKVCKRWVVGDGIRTGFLCFLEDMGERPGGMTLDRINPELHYTPTNCRWADTKTQASNKRKKKVA